MDAELARRLLKLGMDQESMAALLLLPLIEVGWADGSIQPAEQRRIATFAGSLEMGGEAMLFVRTWLRHRPSDGYFDRGRKALSDLLLDGSPQLASLGAEELIREAESLAADNRGWLPFRRGKQDERVVIERLQQQLADPSGLEPTQAEAHPDHDRSVNQVTIDFDAAVRTDDVVYGGVLIPDFVVRVRYEIPAEGLVIGHGEGCDLRLMDYKPIAPTHCRINGRGGRFYIQEMGGETRVNGERVLERRLLGGETIRLAEGCTFAFKRVRKLAPSLV